MTKTLISIIICLCVALVVLLILLLRQIGKRRKWQTENEELVLELTSSLKTASELSNQRQILEGRVDELTKQNERFSKNAYIDQLTELPNANAFLEMLEGTLSTKLESEQVAVLMISLTNYTELLEEAGYAGTEELLIDLSHRLSDALEPGDYIARFSEERFACISQNVAGREEYSDKVKKLMEVVNAPFYCSAKECFAYLAVGATFAPEDADQTGQLIKNAQMALDTAKRLGRNNFCFFANEQVELISKRLSMQADMKRAIDEERFVVRFKKQYTDGKATGRYLAVPCWMHEEKGVLEPKHFYDAAKDDRAAVHIGTFLFDRVCRYMQEWSEAGLSRTTILILVSERELFDRDYCEFVKTCLSKYDIGSGRLEFIIDGKVLLRSPDRLEEVIERLTSLGISFWLAGFGRDLKRLGINIARDSSYDDEIDGDEFLQR